MRELAYQIREKKYGKESSVRVFKERRIEQKFRRGRVVEGWGNCSRGL